MFPYVVINIMLILNIKGNNETPHFCLLALIVVGNMVESTRSKTSEL